MWRRDIRDIILYETGNQARSKLRISSGTLKKLQKRIDPDYDLDKVKTYWMDCMEEEFIDIVETANVRTEIIEKYWTQYSFVEQPIEDFLPNLKAMRAQKKRKNHNDASRKHKKRRRDPEMDEYNPPRKRYKSEPIPEDHKKYLSDLSGRKGLLHRQEWVKKQIKAFHEKQTEYKLAQCQQCFDRWYAKSDTKNLDDADHLDDFDIFNESDNLDNSDNLDDVNCTRYYCDWCKKERRRVRGTTEVPLWGIQNKTVPGKQPLWARNLTQIEEMLISPIIPVMSVYTLNGGSSKFEGNTINFMQDVHEMAQVLPRLPSQIQLLVCRAPGKRLKDVYFLVNRERVHRFLVEAKRRKLPGFKDIIISEENLAALPENGIPDDILTVDIEENDKNDKNDAKMYIKYFYT